MYAGKYTTINRVLERVYSDYGFTEQISADDAAEWIGDCLDRIGVQEIILLNRVTGESASNPTIKISNYMGALPCDLHQVISCRTYPDLVPMKKTTDVFHNSNKEDRAVNITAGLDKTYSFNNNYIKTSFEDGEVEMSYLAFPVDSNGYPMIPDNTWVVAACYSTVAYKLMRKAWIRGEISRDIKEEVEQDYYFAIPAATTKLQMPGIDRMEAWKNNANRAVNKINQHSNGFASAGQQEERPKR